MAQAEPEEWQADKAPRARGQTYPGAWPDSSILLAGDEHFPLSLRRWRRLGQARVLHCDTLPTGEVVSEPELPLDYVLARYNVAPVDQRVPVLAVGSNAAPAQLRHKFAGSGIALVIPLVKATVEGLAAGLAPDVAPYGAIGATPVLGPELTDSLFVQWLDLRQLALLDGTEPGYERLLLRAGDPAGGGVRITLPSGEVLGACYAYVSSRGCLAVPDEVAASADPATMLRDGACLWRLPRHGPPLLGPDGAVDGYDRQRALLTTLLDSSERLRELMGGPDAWYRQTASPGRIDEVRHVFEAEGWVRPCGGLAELRATRGPAAPRPYGKLLPAEPLGDLADLPDGDEPLCVVPSADDIPHR